MFDLKRFRIERKITQTEIAMLFDVSQGYISQVEKGSKELSEDNIKLLKNRYGDDIEEYIKDEQSHSKDNPIMYDEILKEKDLRIQQLQEEVSFYRELLRGQKGNATVHNKQTGT